MKDEFKKMGEDALGAAAGIVAEELAKIVLAAVKKELSEKKIKRIIRHIINREFKKN